MKLSFKSIVDMSLSAVFIPGLNRVESQWAFAAPVHHTTPMVVLDMFQMLLPAFKSKLTIRRSTCVYVKLSHGFVVVALEVEVSTFRLLLVLATYLLLVLVSGLDGSTVDCFVIKRTLRIVYKLCFTSQWQRLMPLYKVGFHKE